MPGRAGSLFLDTRSTIPLSLDRHLGSNPQVPEWEMAEWPDPLTGKKEIARLEVAKPGYWYPCTIH